MLERSAVSRQAPSGATKQRLIGSMVSPSPAFSSWPILLISRVYARMFDRTPIDKKEALELCSQMLIALAALPTSPEQLEYKSTYEAILRPLEDHTPFSLLPNSRTSTLQKTHAYAISFLQAGRDAKDISWLREALYHRQGWWETTYYQLADDSISMGTHAYTVYVFPAVRLASIAVGQYIPCEDPAAIFMEERIQAKRIISEHLSSLDSRRSPTEHRLLETLAALEESLKKYSYDERLWQYQGLVLLRLGKLAEAEASLQHCMDFPWCGNDTQTSAYYNLGCVYAKMAKEDECRKMLMQWSHLQPKNQLDYEWLRQDPDLKEMHKKRWFHDLCDPA
jgi:tetratricopeptide (TPR) repeat protein